jgi:class 3 adenylate cyclase
MLPLAVPVSPVSSAEEGYLLLADISGYTRFMTGVGDAHGFDYAEGIPPGFELMGVLLDSVAGGLSSPFSVAKFEGDAVFAVAAAGDLDGRGSDLLAILRRTYRRFIAARNEADPARNAHECVACALVDNLDLKMVLHEGPYVSQAVHRQTELLGPAVNVVHRMLKSTAADQVGHRHYLYLTDDAARRLGLTDAGIAHIESYDIGDISGRVLDLEAVS